ncbi:hypothetical protein GCM10028792_29430 [Salinisphaera aquimarina]
MSGTCATVRLWAFNLLASSTGIDIAMHIASIVAPAYVVETLKGHLDVGQDSSLPFGDYRVLN